MFYEIVFAESPIWRAGCGSSVVWSMPQAHSGKGRALSVIAACLLMKCHAASSSKEAVGGWHAVLQGCWSPYVSLNEYCWMWRIKIWLRGVFTLFLFFAQLWWLNLCGIPVEKQDRVDQTTCSWPGVAWLCPPSLVSHEPDRHRSQETAMGCPWPLPSPPPISVSPPQRELDTLEQRTLYTRDFQWTLLMLSGLVKCCTPNTFNFLSHRLLTLMLPCKLDVIGFHVWQWNLGACLCWNQMGYNRPSPNTTEGKRHVEHWEYILQCVFAVIGSWICSCVIWKSKVM